MVLLDERCGGIGVLTRGQPSSVDFEAGVGERQTVPG